MDFSAHFHRDDSYVLLNAGSLSRTPLAVLDFMDARRRAEEGNPTKAVFESAGVFWRAQQKVAAFLGVEPNHLYLRSNITSALNDFLFALELGQGEILLTGMEYGATANLVKVRAAQLGLSVRAASLPMNPEITSTDLLEAVASQFTDQTRALVLSHVLTGTGTILPIQQIAEEAKKRGIIVIVDGAHAVGSLPLDISRLGVDFYGGNFHKWFLGPKGTAFGWVNPRLMEQLEWKFGGWASFEIPDSYFGFEGDAEAARRIFPGTMDSGPFAALEEVVKFWQHHGADNLRARQTKLRDHCAALAEEAGFQRVSPSAASLLGPLVAFAKPAHWPAGSAVEITRRIFRECAVQIVLPVVQGQAVVRFSPGVYSSEKEIEAGMGRLKKWG